LCNPIAVWDTIGQLVGPFNVCLCFFYPKHYLYVGLNGGMLLSCTSENISDKNPLNTSHISYPLVMTNIAMV
jgi:hypothetical protein